jgi:hypothetical protein
VSPIGAAVTAPTPPTGSRELVDQLVPPPWSRRRRLVTAAVVTAAAITLGALWWTGTLGPNIGPVSGYGYGALDRTVGTTVEGTRRGTVEIQLELANRGWFPVRDLEVHAPPFLSGSFVQPGGPVELGPRHREQVTFHLVVDDCRRFQAAPFPGLSIHGTSNGVPARGRALHVLGADHVEDRPSWDDAAEPGVSSWWYELAKAVCDPDAFAAP